MISARQATFDFLTECEPGQRLTGFGLMFVVTSRTGHTHFPATMLRYLREYRESSGRQIECIDNQKSIYEVIR